MLKQSPLEMLKLVDLEEKAGSKFKELSGGQKQRFSICTTLINTPKVVFLMSPQQGLIRRQEGIFGN